MIFIVFDRTRTIYVVFHSRGFYDVPRVLIAGARLFQALAAILDYVTHLASVSCWSQAALLRISQERGSDHVCSWWSAKKTLKYQL